MKSDKQSEFYIKKTFQLAREGAGFVSPNPMVGAVVVKNGNIIGQGYHKKFGEAHAEINAIEDATESVNGATLYCNLEPCCHTNKKTPPCAQRIIKAGIKRVVISNLDANPEVNGNGVRLLRDAGIKVETGILEKDGKHLNRFFFKYVIKNIPYVTVKIAQTLDGKISKLKNKQIWITGEEAQKLVHQWRAEFDAVFIGAGTVKIDNPLLSVRYTTGRDPYRIIVDGNLSISIKSKVINKKDAGKTIVFCSTNSDQYVIDDFRNRGVQVIEMESTEEKRINLNDILSKLGKMGIASLLVEGGNQIFSQFIQRRIFDELQIFIAPKLFGNGVPAFSGITVENLGLNLSEYRLLGKDLLLTYLP